jgi:uncharacterized membrane protein YcaP (DUF421 family)
VSLIFSGIEAPLRTVVVGVLAYIGVVVILRVSGKRTLSKMNAFDLVVTVALGSTLATILLSKDVAHVEGITAFLVVKSEPRALIYRGRVLHDALRAERVVESELQAALRAEGYARYDEVDLLVLETDGSFTAVASLPASHAPATDSVREAPPRQARPSTH